MTYVKNKNLLLRYLKVQDRTQGEGSNILNVRCRIEYKVKDRTQGEGSNVKQMLFNCRIMSNYHSKVISGECKNLPRRAQKQKPKAFKEIKKYRHKTEIISNFVNLQTKKMCIKFSVFIKKGVFDSTISFDHWNMINYIDN